MKSVTENPDGTYTIDGKIYAEAGADEKESVFSELVKDLVRKESPEIYPDSVFWMKKNGAFMFALCSKSNTFWYSYFHVWRVFEKLDMNDIQSLIEEHFKYKRVTPKSVGMVNLLTIDNKIRVSIPQIEEHFKGLLHKIYPS